MRILTLATVLAVVSGSAVAATATNTTTPAKTCGKGYVVDSSGTKCVCPSLV